MRRALWIAIRIAIPVLLLGLSAWGQVIRGTPASVTSIRGNRTFVGGVPASVTSVSPTLPFGIAPSFPSQTGNPCAGAGRLIPSAMGCGNPIFPQNMQRFRNDSRRNFRRGRGFGSGPVIVPYAYPYAVYTNYDPYALQRQDQPVQIEIRIVNEDEDRDRDQYSPGEDILVRREDGTDGQARLRLNDERDRPRAPFPSAAPAPQQASEPAREVIPTILIFRDGRRREVRNYAIMGKVLYDLENMASRKVPLAELDLSATVKENDDRGVGFALPRDLQQ